MRVQFSSLRITFVMLTIAIAALPFSMIYEELGSSPDQSEDFWTFTFMTLCISAAISMAICFGLRWLGGHAETRD